MKFTALLLTFAAALYADGIRQSSGPVGQYTPAHGSYSRERVVIDGQYSAMPSGGENEVRGLSASGQVDAITVLPIDGPGVGGGVTDLQRPVPAVSPEPAAWMLIAGGLLMVGLGRKENVDTND